MEQADALVLWYKTLRATLEGLGFVASPFDGCVFSLVAPGKNGQPYVHGCLGIHVDDGISGGDKYFGEVIERLRGIYEFGAYNEGQSEFCGVSNFQWDDGSIELEQNSYIQKIPLEIPTKSTSGSKVKMPSTDLQIAPVCCSAHSPRNFCESR